MKLYPKPLKQTNKHINLIPKKQINTPPYIPQINIHIINPNAQN